MEDKWGQAPFSDVLKNGACPHFRVPIFAFHLFLAKGMVPSKKAACPLFLLKIKAFCVNFLCFAIRLFYQPNEVIYE
jgi:hypothetical protein